MSSSSSSASSSSSSTTTTSSSSSSYTYTYKPALKQYLAAFDGTKKDFTEVEHLFDSLYHEHFTFSTKDGTLHTRDTAKKIAASKLALGSEVTLIHLKRIGLSCVDIKYRLVNKVEDTITRIVFNTLSKKIMRAWVHEDTFRSTLNAKCKNDFYYYWGALLSIEHLPKPDNTVDYKNTNLRRWEEVSSSDSDSKKKGLYHHGLYIYPFVRPDNLERSKSVKQVGIHA